MSNNRTDIKKVESLFKKSYQITVNVREFLSSIQSFNQIAMGTQLQYEDTLLAQKAKRQRNQSKKEKENENIRIIYMRKIKEEPLCGDEQQ